MAVKTITVTQEAYEALKSRKEEHESFSQTILRVSGKRSIWDFAGILSTESADKLEKSIKENRRRDTLAYDHRMKKIVQALEGKPDGRAG